MPPGDRQWILCGMEGTPDPNERLAAQDELGLVATGMTALVAKRILETKGTALSVPNAQTDPTPSARTDEPTPPRISHRRET